MFFLINVVFQWVQVFYYLMLIGATVYQCGVIGKKLNVIVNLDFRLQASSKNWCENLARNLLVTPNLATEVMRKFNQTLLEIFS